jgi:hypothetical protein
MYIGSEKLKQLYLYQFRKIELRNLLLVYKFTSNKRIEKEARNTIADIASIISLSISSYT